MTHIPPPLWTLGTPLALYFLSNLPMFAGWPVWRNEIVGAVVMLIGLIAPAIALRQFLVLGTQVKPTSPENNKLVVTGLYQYTRNPMYVGMTLFTLGVAIWFGRPLMYLAPVLVFTVLNGVHIPFEEAKMRRQFGDQFDAYCAKVRRWI